MTILLYQGWGWGLSGSRPDIDTVYTELLSTAKKYTNDKMSTAQVVPNPICRLDICKYIKEYKLKKNVLKLKEISQVCHVYITVSGTHHSVWQFDFIL